MNTRSKKAVAIVVKDFLQPTQIWILRHAGGLSQFLPFFIAKSRKKPKKRCRHRILALDSFRAVTESINLIGRALSKHRFLGYAGFIKINLWLYRVQLVHIHFLWNAAWFFEYVKRMNLPVIVTAHGSDVNHAFADPEYKRRIQAVFERADKIVCVSEFIREQLKALGCDQAKLVVNYLGVPLRKHLPVEKKKKDVITLICVAALREEKGHVYLIKALQEVRRSYPNIRLILAGDGELKDAIRHVVREYSLEDCVFFLGWKNEVEVYELLADSDIFVQHSIRFRVKGRYYKEEGLPISLVEAASMGLPIVATKIGGIPEACIHGFNGLLSEEKDIHSMAENIVYLIENPDTRSLYGRNGRQLIREKFDESIVLKRLEKIYEGCIKELNSRS